MTFVIIIDRSKLCFNLILMDFLYYRSGKLSPLNGSRSVENGCVGHVCGHKCKKEESQLANAKKNACQESCDHQKEPKKCDCAYCEVFGSVRINSSFDVNTKFVTFVIAECNYSFS